MVGYIYLIIDLTNWKKYVGQHHYHLEKLDSSYHGSGTIISKIYKKRPETLKEVYLKTCYTQEELDEWEQYYIKFYNTLYPNGYNLEKGGRGGVPSEETKNKMSEAAKGKHHSEETRKKLSESHKGKTTWNKGMKMSDEHRKKLSEAHMGKIPANKGVKMTDEQRKKCSESHKGQIPWNKKKIIQLTLDGIFICEWASINEAQSKLGIKHISDCCQGKRKSAGGFKWCYAEE